MPKAKPKLEWRPYGKRIHEQAAQAAMVHFHAHAIHNEMYPDSKRGGRGNRNPMEQDSAICYTRYASLTTGLPEQYLRDLVRIGRCVPEDFLLTIMGTEMDNFMYLLNIASVTEDFKNDKQT